MTPEWLMAGDRSLLDAMLDSIDVGVVACDTEGRLTNANRRARELFGETCPDGTNAASWAARLHARTPDGLPLPVDDFPVIAALAGRVVTKVDILADTGQGDLLFNASARPVLAPDGRALGALVTFEDVTEQRARERELRGELEDLQWIGHVDEALDEGRLLLHAQPIRDLRTGELRLEELLLRMRATDGKIIGPSEFLPAAERQGTIDRVDQFVLERALQISAGGRPVSINVSAHTVSSPQFLETVECALGRGAIDPGLITFEITETAIVSDIVQASRFAERLEALGCQFALDDFGTGYAALTYLKHLPIRYLKIDMSFVRDLVHDRRSQAVVSGIVALANGFGLETIAEGVEDGATANLLSELGVGLGQGWFLGRPVPTEP